jgi:hypothetical protein
MIGGDQTAAAVANVLFVTDAATTGDGSGCALGHLRSPDPIRGRRVEPRGILHHAGTVYWVDDGSNGEVMAWDGTLASAQYPVALNLDTRPPSPAVFRLAEGDPTAQVLYATGALPSLTTPPAYDLAVFKIDLAGAAAQVAIYKGAAAETDVFNGLVRHRTG